MEKSGGPATTVLLGVDIGKEAEAKLHFGDYFEADLLRRWSFFLGKKIMALPRGFTTVYSRSFRAVSTSAVSAHRALL